MLTQEEKTAIFDKLWENSMVGIALINQEGRFLNANPQYCTLVGYSEAELREKTYHQLTHPEDLHADAQMRQEIVLGERQSFDMQKRYLRKFEGIIPIVLRVVRMEKGVQFTSFLVQIVPIKPVEVPHSDKPKLKTRIREKWHFLILPGLLGFDIVLGEAIKYLRGGE